MYKPQRVSVPNNTRSKHSERNRDVFRPVGTMASGPPVQSVQNVPRDIFCTYICRSLAYHQTRARSTYALSVTMILTTTAIATLSLDTSPMMAPSCPYDL